MKICFLSSIYSKYWPNRVGPQTYYADISRGLCKLGHDVTVVTSGPKGEVYNDGPVRVAQVGTLREIMDIKKLLSPFYLFERFSYMLNAARFIAKNNFDIIQAADCGIEQLFLIFNKRCPLVTRLHGMVTDLKRDKLKNARTVEVILKFLERLVLLKSDGVTSPSKSYADYTRKKYRIAKDIDVIPNGIDFNVTYNHVNVRGKYDLGNKKIVLFAGIISWRKGIDMLTVLAERLKDRKDLVFVLLGDMYDKYDITRFSPNVLFLGRKEKDELFSFYKECDLFLIPSRFETFCNVILEAMLFSKPILASNAIGIKDLVLDGKNGFLFDCDNLEDLCEKFNRLIDNDELLSAFGRESGNLCAGYEINNVVKRTESYYIRLCRTFR